MKRWVVKIKDPGKNNNYTIILVFVPDKDCMPRYYDTKINTSEIMEKNFSITIPPVETLPFVEGKFYDFIKNDEDVKFMLQAREKYDESRINK